MLSLLLSFAQSPPLRSRFKDTPEHAEVETQEAGSCRVLHVAAAHTKPSVSEIRDQDTIQWQRACLACAGLWAPSPALKKQSDVITIVPTNLIGLYGWHSRVSGAKQHLWKVLCASSDRFSGAYNPYRTSCQSYYISTSRYTLAISLAGPDTRSWNGLLIVSTRSDVPALSQMPPSAWSLFPEVCFCCEASF